LHQSGFASPIGADKTYALVALNLPRQITKYGSGSQTNTDVIQFDDDFGHDCLHKQKAEGFYASAFTISIPTTLHKYQSPGAIRQGRIKSEASKWVCTI